MTPQNRPRTALSSTEQNAVARKIIAAENEIRSLLGGLVSAEQVLNKNGPRPERTRAGSVDRMEAAIAAAEADATLGSDARRRVRDARGVWDRAADLRWTLALSAWPIARGESRALAGPLLEEEDLLQEGIIGLLNAAKRFDPERGVLFDTYARWWARAQITRAIEKGGRTVRIPSCAVEQMRNLRRAKEQKAQAHTSVAALAAETGIRERRARLLLSQGATVSLEQPVDFDRNPRTLGQTLVDEDAEAPDNHLIVEDQLDKVNTAFGKVLSDRDQYILTRRFGLDRDSPRTLTQVGREIGLSRERVRQLEKAALARLGRASGVLREGAVPINQRSLYRRSARR